jgi:hypothetical protein
VHLSLASKGNFPWYQWNHCNRDKPNDIFSDYVKMPQRANEKKNQGQLQNKSTWKN